MTASKHKILIIEDNTGMRENIQEILELSNYEVQATPDGLVGIQLARQFKPDLVLCDIMMPNLDGFGVLKIMQQDPHLQSIPLIFLTAKAEKEDFRKGMNLGAEDYLVKPFEDFDLLEVISKKLQKYEDLAKNRTSKTLAGLIEFEHLDRFPKVVDLIQQSPTKAYGKKSKIWSSQEKVNSIFFIEQGILKEGIDTVGDKEFIFEFYGGPGFAGITHLFQGIFHSHCEVVEPATIKAISRKQLEEIILQENLWTSFQHYFSQLCQQHLTRLALNSFGNVREKVAFHLAQLSKKITNQTITLGREDLASYCGIAKETLIRNLTELKEDKVIEIDPQGIKIINIQKLNTLFSV